MHSLMARRSESPGLWAHRRGKTSKPAQTPPKTQRIAVVIAGLGAGGAERVLSIITQRWIAKGRDVWIISFDSPQDRIFHEFSSDIRFIRLGSYGADYQLFRILEVMRRILNIRKILRRINPELTVSFLTKINVITLLSVMSTRNRVIISERNNPIAQNAHPLWRFVLSKLSWRADAIIMQTRASLACLDRSARIRARVIPNPVLLGNFSPKSEGLVLAAVGRLTYQKGFDLLLRAFEIIGPHHPEWELHIWGDGEEAEFLASEICRLKLEGRVRLRGVSRNPEEWVSSASAFVLSSRYEGFGNVLAEAMVGGLPVVAYDCDFGPGEIIRDGIDGILVPVGDVCALASALGRIMGDRELRRHLGDAARAAARRYDPDAIIELWEEVITRVMPQLPCKSALHASG